MSANTFAKVFGAGAADGGNTIVLSFTESGTYTAPFACTVDLLVQGAGGGGASFLTGLGGNSGPWGILRVLLEAGDVLTIAIGAGGAGGGTTASNGSQGGTTTVQLNGVTILSAQGGEGGIGSASGSAILNPAAAAAVVTGADTWFPGLQAGSNTSGFQTRTGGAAINLCGNGKGRSPNITTNPGGSLQPGGSAGTVTPDNSGVPSTPINTISWFSFGLYPITDSGKGSPGSSSAKSPTPSFGGGGGGAGSAGFAGGDGGTGAGGGAGPAAQGGGGRGGSGYVSLQVTMES